MITGLVTLLPAAAAVLSVVAIGAGVALLRLPGRRTAQTEDAGLTPWPERLVRGAAAPADPLLRSRWGRRYQSRLAETLVRAGRRGSSEPRRELEIQAGGAILSTAAAVMVAGRWWPAGLVFGAVMVGARPAGLRREARRRQDAVERALPLFLELMAVLIKAGHSFRYALHRVSERLTGPLSDEIRLMLAEVEFGRDVGEALERMAGRSSAPSMRRLVGALAQNLELGAPVGEMLGDIAQEARTELVIDIRLRAEGKANRAAVALALLALPGALAMAMAVLVNELLVTAEGLSDLGL